MSAGRLLLFACVAASLVIAVPGRAGDHAEEPKPAIDVLPHLAAFVEWPAAAFSGDGAPFVIGILGHDPFGPALDEQMARAYVGRRAIVVRRMDLDDDPSICHLLFVAGVEDERLSGVWRKLRGQPVLTVGEGLAFVRAGGMIGLGHRGPGKMMFLNQVPLRQAGLSASSKLLELAEVIEEGEGAP